MVIENGDLGLSSHHGVHGNRCKGVVLRNLRIFDFEVGAISVNSGRDFVVEDCEVGPSSRIVPVLGGFSSGRQLVGYLESLDQAGYLCFDTEFDRNNKVLFLKVGGKILTVKKVLEDLNLALEKTEEAFLNGNNEDIPEFFRNEDGFPDGGTLYGIVFHSNNPAVGPFNDLDNNTKSNNIHIKNVTIKELTHKLKERISLQLDSETETQNIKSGQKDVRDSAFNILTYTDKNGN